MSRSIVFSDVPPVQTGRFGMLEEEAELPDPVALIRKAIEADLDPSVFTEKEFPVAPNVIEWCTGAQYLGTNIQKPFAKQFEVLVHLFRDCCYECSDPAYIYDVPVDAHLGDLLERFVLLQHGTCPKCKLDRRQILERYHLTTAFRDHRALDEDVIPRPVPPNEFVGVWGQRSGKSLTVGTFVFPYVLHRYLALPSVTRYFDEPESQILDAVFVAPILKQVSTFMWEPFKQVYHTSPWFTEVIAHIKDREKRLGVQLYREQQTYIAFVGKRLACHMAAANAGTLRGGTRFFATVDELGWFNISEDGKDVGGAKSGGQVYTALKNSLSTLQQASEWRRRHLGDHDAVDAYMCNVSSPSSVNDPIMQLGDKAPRRPRMYFTHWPTWEVNPKQFEDALREEHDPLVFQRDFAAIPPKAASPFFEDDGFGTLTSLVWKPPAPIRMFNHEIKVAEDPMGGRMLLRPNLRDVRPDRTTPRIMTVDNGEKKNAFAICISRYMPDRDGVLLEALIEVCPWKGHVIDLAWCYDEVVVNLIRNFNFLHVGYDRWESTYAINDLRTNLKVDAERYSLKWKDFENFRNDIRAAKVWFMEPEEDPGVVLGKRDLSLRAATPHAHLMVQLCTVNQFGKRVFKPDGGNDDLFRTAVLAHRFIRANQKVIAQKSKFLLRQGGPERFVARYVSGGQKRYSMTMGAGARQKSSSRRGPSPRERGLSDQRQGRGIGRNTGQGRYRPS